MTAHRADIHTMLRAAIGDAPLRLGAICISADTVNGMAVAHFADGSEIEADVVIGADGIRSAIRAQHFGADPPRFTEMMAWRCMVPMDCVPRASGPTAALRSNAASISAGIGPNGHVICYPIGATATCSISSPAT